MLQRIRPPLSCAGFRRSVAPAITRYSSTSSDAQSAAGGWKVEDRTAGPQNRHKITVVTMNSNKVNALNPAFFEDLHQAMDKLEQRDNPHQPVIFTSAFPKTFGGGLDLQYFLSLQKGEQMDHWISEINKAYLRLFTLPSPTLAAVNGHAIAGGLLLALACDYRVSVSSDSVRMGLKEVALGLTLPSVTLALAESALPPKSFREATLTAKLYTPKEALERQIVDELVDTNDQAVLLDAACRHLTEKVLPEPRSDHAYATIKRDLQAPLLKRLLEESRYFTISTTTTTTTTTDAAAPSMSDVIYRCPISLGSTVYKDRRGGLFLTNVDRAFIEARFYGRATELVSETLQQISSTKRKA